MAGLDMGGDTRGGRRALSQELNMVPMIDLMMVTISFLLITAVWTTMSRINTNANVQRQPGVDPPTVERRLHVQSQDPNHFLLVWKDGSSVISTTEVARDASVQTVGETRVVRYDSLARAMQDEWKRNGAHRDATDANADRVVVHAPNEMPYSDLVGVLDAVSAPRNGERPAFDVTFAAD